MRFNSFSFRERCIRMTGLQTRPDPLLQGFLPLIGNHFIWFGDHCSGILADVASDGNAVVSGRVWRPDLRDSHF